MQAAFLKPDLLLVGEVSGDGGVGDAQVFDVDIADDLADLPEDLFAANRAEAKTHVDQAQHIQIVETFDPVFVNVEFAGGVDPADHGTHRTAGNAGDFVTAFLDLFNDPDMGIAPGATGAQYQRDTFFFHPASSRQGSTMHPSPGRLNRRGR
ncbi:hypothetical protein D3C85_670240 [compost metagenome]